MNSQKERLLLLRDSGVICQDIYQSVSHLLDFLQGQCIVDDEDRLNLMTVHIAMALMRARTHETILEVDEGVKGEVVQHPRYALALSFWEKNSFLDILPEGEKYYVLANLCNIIKE